MQQIIITATSRISSQRLILTSHLAVVVGCFLSLIELNKNTVGKKRSASQNSPPILFALVGGCLNGQKLINYATSGAINLPPESGKMGDIMPTVIVRKKPG
jgi:hypothetical protein